MPQIVRQHTAVRMPRTTVESGNASASAPVPPQMTQDRTTPGKTPFPTR